MIPRAEPSPAQAGPKQAPRRVERFRKIVALAMVPVIVVTTACGGQALDEPDTLPATQAHGFESAAEIAERLQAMPRPLSAEVERQMLADIEQEDLRIAALRATMTPEEWQAAERSAIGSLEGSGLVEAGADDRMRSLRLTSNSSGGCTAHHVKQIPANLNFARLAHRVATTSGLSNFIYGNSYAGPRIPLSGSVTVNAQTRTFYAWQHASTSCASLSASNAPPTWVARLAGGAAAIAVAIMGNAGGVALFPEFAAWVPIVVGCFAGATYAVVTNGVLNRPQDRQAAIDAGVACIIGAGLPTASRLGGLLGNYLRANAPSGFAIATGWMRSYALAWMGPAIAGVTARLPASS